MMSSRLTKTIRCFAIVLPVVIVAFVPASGHSAARFVESKQHQSSTATVAAAQEAPEESSAVTA